MYTARKNSAVARSISRYAVVDPARALTASAGGGREEETAFLPVGSQLIKMEAKWKQGRVYGVEEASPCFLVQGAVQ